MRVNELGRRLTCGKRRPLHVPERVRDNGLLIAVPSNNDWHEECLLLGHVVCTFRWRVPFVSKVTLKTLLGVLGDNRE